MILLDFLKMRLQMRHESRNKQKEISISCDYEVKQQILDVTVIVIIFLMAMFCGKICMERCGRSWVAFNIPAFGVAIIGLYAGYCLRKICITRRKKKRYPKESG